MTDSAPVRLSASRLRDLQSFITLTAESWMDRGLIKPNSYGVEIITALKPGADFEEALRHMFGGNHLSAEHDAEWYQANAHGKNIICEETDMDSHEAIRLWPGLIRNIEGAYPYGGAIIDPVYGLIIGTSGFKEDEDLLFSRTIHNYLVMLLNREGENVLDGARQRGEQEGEAGADRFTRLAA